MIGVVFLCPEGGSKVTKEDYLKYLKKLMETITEMADDCVNVEQSCQLLWLQKDVMREIYLFTGDTKDGIVERKPFRIDRDRD